MGITGELVRSVFSKSRSVKTQDTIVRRPNVEKKKWRPSVRAMLCGDEVFNSVLAEEDSASVKSSEATVTQPVHDGHSTLDSQFMRSEETTQTDSTESDEDQRHASRSKSLNDDAAAIIIQSAFRGFMVRCLRANESADVTNELLKGLESPSCESLATSIEVQTGNSIGVASIQGEIPSVCTKVQHKPKPPVFKPKEDWDDSTVDSSVSKLRIQNRVEAMTRRERALAYAFSQQLRICSKKRQADADSADPNTGWSWLERWMATRQPEASSVEDHINKQLNKLTITMKTRPNMKKFLNLSFEERESCGSNDVPVQLGDSVIPRNEHKDDCKSNRNRLKSPRYISRRKTFPTHHYQKEHTKVNRRDGSRESDKGKRQKVKQLGIPGVCRDDASQLSPDHSAAFQDSKSDP